MLCVNTVCMHCRMQVRWSSYELTSRHEFVACGNMKAGGMKLSICLIYFIGQPMFAVLYFLLSYIPCSWFFYYYSFIFPCPLLFAMCNISILACFCTFFMDAALTSFLKPCSSLSIYGSFKLPLTLSSQYPSTIVQKKRG